MNQQKQYATTQRAQEFLVSSEGLAAYAALVEMESNAGYKTLATYSPRSENGHLSFIDKHMGYLCTHLGVNADQYVSNLRLITKVRS
jgi:hypothetical protein